jgi:hypothetical protein
MRIVFLISCVSQKVPAAKAEDLYQSDWFKKARAFVEAQRASWLILSAKHGVVVPSEFIAPYDLTLNEMPVERRRVWAAVVLEQLGRILADTPTCLVILAGKKYREFIIDPLTQSGHMIQVPMEGLGIGEQKQWLKKKIESLSGPASLSV